MTPQYKLDTANAFWLQEDGSKGAGRYVVCTPAWGGYTHGCFVIWKLGAGRKRQAKWFETDEAAIEFAKRKCEE